MYYSKTLGSNKATENEGKQMFTTPDGVALYTEDDMNEAREAQRSQFVVGTEYGVRSENGKLRDQAYEYFKSEVRGGSMIGDDALDIFNGLCEALGWATADSLATTFTVCVAYNGMDVAQFNDVEAEDEESAEAEVRGNFSIDDVETSFTLSYNGESCTESVNMTYYFEDEFEFTASEN